MEILKTFCSSLKPGASIDYIKLAYETTKFSGVEIINLINEVALNRNDQSEIQTRDFEAVLEKINQNKSEEEKVTIKCSYSDKNFDSIAGYVEIKDELKETVDFLNGSSNLTRFGGQPAKLILLLGAKGNGKSLIAKSIAGQAHCPIYSIEGNDLTEVEDLFNEATQTSPCVIYINCLESGKDQNQLACEINKIYKLNKKIVVVISTEKYEVIDDLSEHINSKFPVKEINVEMPFLSDRYEILKMYTTNVKIDANVNLHQLAKEAYGFSCVDLINLINEASLIVSNRSDKKFITMKDFEQAGEDIRFGKKNLSITITDEQKRKTAYHESGHALALILLFDQTNMKEAYSFLSVTLIPRGNALGITVPLKNRDYGLDYKKEILARITMSLASRAAEEIVFGPEGINSGIIGDFQTANLLAQHMVHNLGMSNFGVRMYDRANTLGTSVYSQKTAEKLDDAVQKILDDCYQRAKKLLTDNRDKLDKLANALVERGTLYASEVYELLGLNKQ
jgi:cell division protease FtsH